MIPIVWLTFLGLLPFSDSCAELRSRAVEVFVFNIGDRIVYGTKGVFVLVDIREECVLGERHKYYVLSREGTRSESLVYVPTDNEALCAEMRRPLTKAEAEALIAQIPNIPAAEWNRDSHSRTERFRNMLESGDHRAIVSVIKSVWQSSQDRRLAGKKTFVSDENMEKLILVVQIPEGMESELPF